MSENLLEYNCNRESYLLDFGFWIEIRPPYIASEEGGFERIFSSGKCGLGVSPSRAPFQDRIVIRFINPPLQTLSPSYPPTMNQFDRDRVGHRFHGLQSDCTATQHLWRYLHG
jgi:hypothetical protein